MMLINLLAQNRLAEAKEVIFSRLNDIVAKRIEETKRALAADIYDEELTEANVMRQGRIQKIRRRIRRNTKGQIVVQRNVKRSAIKGFRISGNTVKRIPAIARIQKARKLKRYWKTKGRAKMNRVLLKRKMSMRRRKSMGIR